MTTAIQLVEETAKGSPLPGYKPYLDKKKKCMLFFALLKYFLFNMNKIKRSMHVYNEKSGKTREYLQSDIREKISETIEAFLRPSGGKFALEEVKLLCRDFFIDFYHFRNGKTELLSEGRFAEIFYAHILGFISDPNLEQSIVPFVEDNMKKWNDGGSPIKAIQGVMKGIEKFIDEKLEKNGVTDAEERRAFRERHTLEFVCEAFEPAYVQA